MPIEDSLSQYFEAETNLDFDIISTIDHPYINPPIRLINSHHILSETILKGKKVCVLNWNVSQPNNRTYRYDNQLDLVFIGKNSALLVFDDKIPYAIQNGNKINLSAYYKIFSLILERLIADKKISEESAEFITRNLNVIKNTLIQNIINANDGHLINKYTKIYLQNFYNIIGHKELSKFIANNYLYFYDSTIARKWIPFCIKNAPKQKTLIKLIDGNVISRRLFRSTTSDIDEKIINDRCFIKNEQNYLIELIINGRIIPSIDIFYWSMELANKKHFGNDYGFFQRYSNFLNLKLDNQLTNMSDKPDGKNILQIKEDYSLAIQDNNVRYRTIGSKSKPSRINSMTAIYLLTGDYINNIDLAQTRPKTIEIIDGNIVIH